MSIVSPSIGKLAHPGNGRSNYADATFWMQHARAWIRCGKNCVDRAEADEPHSTGRAREYLQRAIEELERVFPTDRRSHPSEPCDVESQTCASTPSALGLDE